MSSCCLLTDLYTVAIFSFLNADFINNLDPMNRIFSSVQQIQPISDTLCGVYSTVNAMFSRFTDIDLFVFLTTLPMFTAIVLRLFTVKTAVCYHR